MTPQEVTRFLSLLTMLSNILVISFLVTYLLHKINIYPKLWVKFVNYIKPKTMQFAFLVALSAMLGSLYFSEVALYEPCKLCWFQRIFMYPLTFIFATALIKNLKEAFLFAKPLVVTGGIISIYHYYLQNNPVSLAPCGTVGFSVSCSERYVTNLGYITIPWMSFSAFVILLLLMSLAKLSSKK